MRSARGLLKPEYVFQPSRLAKRLRGVRSHDAGPLELELPWGLSIEMRAFDGRAQAIGQFGIHDLVVTEAIWRLASPGDTLVDAGANVGYMTIVMAARLASTGRIHAFEPHPVIFPELTENIRRAKTRFAGVDIESHREALSDREGSGWLAIPANWDVTRGTAHLGAIGDRERGFEVTTRRLDDYAVRLGPVGLLKVDVEGHEGPLLRGAEAMLARGQIRHVVFEEHGSLPTEATSFLESLGYTLFSLECTLLRPRLGDPRAPRRRAWEPPSILATRDPAGAQSAFADFGWRSLRRVRA